MAFLADAVCSKWHFWANFLALLLPILLAALNLSRQRQITLEIILIVTEDKMHMP